MGYQIFLQLRVDDILIRGLNWSKLLDPDKKGQWWLSGDIAPTVDNIKEVAGTIDREVPEAQKMLQLAAAQRMNTDARRAIFCIIMSGEDYIDAFEKLLRLDLPGKQVTIFCCLHLFICSDWFGFTVNVLACRIERSCEFLWSAVCRSKHLTSTTVFWLPNCAAMTKITNLLYRCSHKISFMVEIFDKYKKETLHIVVTIISVKIIRLCYSSSYLVTVGNPSYIHVQKSACFYKIVHHQVVASYRQVWYYSCSLSI